MQRLREALRDYENRCTQSSASTRGECIKEGCRRETRGTVENRISLREAQFSPETRKASEKSESYKQRDTSQDFSRSLTKLSGGYCASQQKECFSTVPQQPTPGEHSTPVIGEQKNQFTTCRKKGKRVAVLSRSLVCDGKDAEISANYP